MSINGSVNILDQIGVRVGKNGISIKTYELKAFIEKYGVDYQGNNGNRLIHYTKYMSHDQIKLLFSYKPNLYDRSSEYLHHNFIYDNNGAFTFEMILRNDVDFSYVTKQIFLRIKDSGGCYAKAVYLSELRTLLPYYATRYTVMSNIMWLLDGHKKKYHTLFDLLINWIFIEINE